MMPKYHHLVSTTNSMSFAEKTKSCSKAIITFLGQEKHHLIKEHKPDTYDQRVQSERDTQRESFRNECGWTKAKDESNKQVKNTAFFPLWKIKDQTHTLTHRHTQTPKCSLFFL